MLIPTPPSRHWGLSCAAALSICAATGVHAQDLRAQCTGENAAAVFRVLFANEIRTSPAYAQVLSDPQAAPVKAAINDCQAGREGGGRAGMERWIGAPQNRQYYVQAIIAPALAQSSELRKGIDGSYQTAFGRSATPGEIEFWAKDPRGPFPQQILDGHRAWLQGGNEVQPTITRSYQEALKRNPSADELKFWTEQIRTRRLLYGDLVANHRDFIKQNPSSSPTAQAECNVDNARAVLTQVFATELARAPILMPALSQPNSPAVDAAINDCKAGREGGGVNGMRAWVSKADTKAYYWNQLGLKSLALSADCTVANAQSVLEVAFRDEIAKTNGLMRQAFANADSMAVKAAINDCRAGREGGGAQGMRAWVTRPENKAWYLKNLIQQGQAWVSDVQIPPPTRSGVQELRQVQIQASIFTPLSVRLSYQPRNGGAVRSADLGQDWWTGVLGKYSFDLTLHRTEPALGNINPIDYTFWIEVNCAGCRPFRSANFGYAEDEIRAAELAKVQQERDRFCKENASLLIAYDGTETDQTARSSILQLWERFSGIGGCQMAKFYYHGPSMLGWATSKSGTGGGELGCRDFECNFQALFQEACKPAVANRYNKVFVIGFSRGGMNAIRFANDFPGFCAGNRQVTFIGVIDPVDTIMGGNFNNHKQLYGQRARNSLKVIKKNQSEHVLTTHPAPGFKEERIINIPEHPDESGHGGHWSMNSSTCKSGRWSEEQLASKMRALGVDLAPTGQAGPEACR